MGFDPVLLGRPPTWDDVFQDTEGALAKVYDAMDRPECLPPAGELRFEHREACAADDMARLAILRLDCARLMFQLGYSGEVATGVWEGQPGDRDDFETRQRAWEIDLLRLDRAADTADYQTRRDRMDGDWYAAMWRAGRCRALPSGVFTKIGPFGPATGWPRIAPNSKLFKTAARLGSEWALSIVLNQGRWAETLPLDERSLTGLQAERPALAELMRLRRAHLRWDWDPAPRRVTMLMHAATALAIGEAVNADIHADAVWGPAQRFFPDGVDEPDRAAGVALAARRLIGMGWTVVVSGGEDEAGRVFTHADDVHEDDPWWTWWDAGRVSVRQS